MNPRKQPEKAKLLNKQTAPHEEKHKKMQAFHENRLADMFMYNCTTKGNEDRCTLLPIIAYKNKIIELVTSSEFLVIVGETGSGKTTQIPKYLYESGVCGDGIICCTQPRRISTISIAHHVAAEMGEEVGNRVGYSVRFDDKTSINTKIQYMTDGMLLREFINDPLLRKISAIMVDEAHERSINTDLLLCLLKNIRLQRKDLHVVISSATINAHRFSTYFEDAPILTIPGRSFPVDIFYIKTPISDYLLASVATITKIHCEDGEGDILVFLTGQEEIEIVAEALSQLAVKSPELSNLIIHTVYASMPADHQAKIFLPTPPTYRKVIIATNIAETSITIEGIVYVVDCGMVKRNNYNPTFGVSLLEVVPCSKASADQRAGRAGRVSPGKCYRLYTQSIHKSEMPDNPIPEIQRSDLTTMILFLKNIGISNILHLEFLDRPFPRFLSESLSLLYSLGALNSKGDLTTTGQVMADFPIDPRLAKMLLHAYRHGHLEEALVICAVLSSHEKLFFLPHKSKSNAYKRIEKFYAPGGDHSTILNIWDEWKESKSPLKWCSANFVNSRTLRLADNIRIQLQSQLHRLKGKIASIPPDPHPLPNGRPSMLKDSLVAGYHWNIAMRQGNKGSTIFRNIRTGKYVEIHPRSSLFKFIKTTDSNYIIYHELIQNRKILMMHCTAIGLEDFEMYSRQLQLSSSKYNADT